MGVSRLVTVIALLGIAFLGQALGEQPHQRDLVRRLPPVTAEPGVINHFPVVQSWFSQGKDSQRSPKARAVGYVQAAPPLNSDAEGSEEPMVDDGYVDQDFDDQNYESDQLSEEFESENREEDGNNFVNSSDDFEEGLVIWGCGAAMKIGGYVKVDLIQDFNPIDSTDTFDTTTIPVGAPERTNSRAHARQSRFNFDTRWPTDRGPVRVFIEADFFGEGNNQNDNRLRLRHAYGKLNALTVGQTWTTFTDRQAIPNTLDNEGGVSSVKRRQALIRWNQPLIEDTLFAAIALEDSRSIIEVPDAIIGDPRTPSPDFVGHIHLSRDWGQLQAAGLIRQLGFQRPGMPVNTENAWGFNFTGALFPLPGEKVYYQVLFGKGIGSYRGLPDVTASLTEYEVLGTFGWMVGWSHRWAEHWKSNFTYSVSNIDNADFQKGGELHENNYLAVNLIWNPATRLFVGLEYLYGTRTNVDGERGEANRLQASFGFYLP